MQMRTIIIRETFTGYAMKRLLLATLLLPLAPAALAEEADYKLVIANHRFTPETLTIPSGKKVKLLIENRDATPEEFDSHYLNREKVMMGKTKATVFIGPLQPGQYKFQGEFHPATAQGVVVVK